MKCEEFDLRIDELLDDRVCPSTNGQIVSHAAECNSCRQTLVAVTALVDGLEFVDVPEISSDFTDRVIGAASQPVRRHRSTTAIITMLAVVAAVFLLAVIPSVHSWLKPEIPTASKPDDKDDSTPTKSKSSDDASRFADKTSTLDKPDEPTPPGNLNEQPDENAVLASLAFPNLRSSLSGMSRQIDSDKIPGIRPIRSSFEVVIGLIRRAIPGYRSDDSSKPQAGLRFLETLHVS